MEKIKCTNCGGDMSIDENGKYATCSYCGTKYKLDKDINVNINIDDNLKKGISGITKSFPLLFIPFIIVFVLALIIIITISTSIFSKKDNINNNFNNYEETITDKINEYEDLMKDAMNNEEDNFFEENMNEFNIQKFNMSFEIHSGTNEKFFVTRILDQVITSNKKNPNNLITVIYEDKNAINEEEIVEIKNLLNKDYYEISFDYNENGYINRLNIK